MKAELSQKDEEFREFSLEAPMWKVILHVGFPLALYESLNQLFKILDTMMASHIGATAVSTVAYLSQINLMLSAIGGGLAVGAGMKISEAYGAGDLELVKRRVSTVFALCAVLGGALLLVLVPFARGFLKLMNTPDEILGEGTVYFRLELFGLVLSFFNSIYIAVERARGNSRRILYLNTAVIAVKLFLTALFVYGMGGGVSMIAVATLASQAVLFVAALVNMNQKESAFGFSVKAIAVQGEVLSPMLSLSFPVIVEKAAFSMGKVIVNSMSTVYGTWTVGALGISNNIDGNRYRSAENRRNIVDGAEKIHALNLKIQYVCNKQRKDQLQRHGDECVPERDPHCFRNLRCRKYINIVLQCTDHTDPLEEVVIGKAVVQRRSHRIKLKNQKTDQPRQNKEKTDIIPAKTLKPFFLYLVWDRGGRIAFVSQ